MASLEKSWYESLYKLYAYIYESCIPAMQKVDSAAGSRFPVLLHST